MIYKQCTMTIAKNGATLDEDIYLYRLDKNIELHFTIVNNKYKFEKSDLNNIIAQTQAAYFQVRLYKNADIKYTFAIQPTDNGKAILKITDDLIDDPIEVGEYDFQISLLDADKTSMISMPIVSKQLHVCEPLVSDTALMGKAVLGLSTAANGEIKNAFDSQGNYIREIHSDGEIISAQLFNKFEEALETNTKAIKANTGGGSTGGTGTSYDDTAIKNDISTIKTDINSIKTDLGTTQLTTTAKDVKGAINEVNKKIGTGTTPTVNSVEPQDDDIPKVFFSGEKPTSKSSVHATMEYKSKTEHFKGYVDIKCQGTSSMAYPKKNYTIKMFTDSTMAKKVKKDFKGWGAQSKFCLKANYIDHSHARNICSAKLWNQIVASRTNYSLLPELLRTSPCNGAIDGFPIKVYYNNNYEGVYTWNIPKDKWMFNMDDTLDNHCVLCGEEYTSGCFLTANASAWSDEIHDTMPASIVTSFNAFQNFVINSSDEQFKTNLENYVYVDSLIDYYIFQYVICGLDSMGKNQLFATYDGTKWIATSYDMDSTFGIYWNGQKFVAPTYRMQDDYESVKNGAANKLYVRLEKLFVNEIKARYSQLRADILSYNNIVNTFEPFMDTIGNDLYAEDLTIYSGIPSGSTNNIQQIRNYYRDRVTYVDAQINKLVSAIACTNITLNNTTLSFTTDAAQTLTATVTPTDTTDKVVWSVSPTGFVTVNNGVITPVNNGACVITATCGTQSATCNVTVNLPVQAVTALNLDKDSITLGNSADADTSNVNLLEGVNHTIDTNNNIVFDSITLDSGIYIFKNINGGSFTWLGANYNGTNFEIGNVSEDAIFKFDNRTAVQFHAFPNNKATNTADKLGLYKIATTLTNPIKFTLAGHGYYSNGNFVEDDNNVYSTAVNLDASKKYVLMNEGANQVNDGNCTWKIDNGSGGKNVTKVLVNFPIKVFENVTSLSISINTVNNALADITLYEAASATTKFEDTLTATLTPPNATNKNVTWTADNENVQLVANGLNCTVKAKAVGDSIVTCTSQDTTNGTITDTCNVTVNAVPATPNVLYTLPQATTFNGTSDYIDTGVKLFDTAKDFTLYIDFSEGAGNKDSNSVFHCIYEQSPYRGLCLNWANNGYFLGGQDFSKSNNAYLGKLTPGKYLIEFKNGVISRVFNSSGELSINDTPKTNSPYVQHNKNLLLGCYQALDGTKGRYWKGTIDKFSVWFRTLTDEERTTLFQ